MLDLGVILDGRGTAESLMGTQAQQVDVVAGVLETSFLRNLRLLAQLKPGVFPDQWMQSEAATGVGSQQGSIDQARQRLGFTGQVLCCSQRETILKNGDLGQC